NEIHSESFTTFHELNDCFSCGNTVCYKHPNQNSSKKDKEVTTYILDEKWVEFDEYIESVKEDADVFILPLKMNKFIPTQRYNWDSAFENPVKYANWQGLRRAISLRY